MIIRDTTPRRRMTDYFALQMTSEKIGSISTLGLAHMGDAVYELMVRSWICERGNVTANEIHREAVRMVSSPAQARAVPYIMDMLTPEEAAVFKRGRNAKSNSEPRHVSPEIYHTATGLETLFGWLYLRGDRDRLTELFEAIAAGTA